MNIKTDRLEITEFTLDMVEAVHLNSLDEDNRKFNPNEVFIGLKNFQMLMKDANFIRSMQNMLLLIVARFLGRLIVVNAVQPLNALEPIEMTFAGMVISVSS